MPSRYSDTCTCVDCDEMREHIKQRDAEWLARNPPKHKSWCDSNVPGMTPHPCDCGGIEER